MTAASSRPPLAAEPSHEALEQAADWFALLLSGEASAADRRRWEDWLSSADEHRQAWGYVETLSSRFHSIKTSAQPRLAASAYRQASGVLGRRRQMLLSAAALAGSGLLGWTAWRHTGMPVMAQAWTADYRAGTGAVRAFTLADGSRVWLNAVSAFNQDYQEGHRLLSLVQGELLIDTASDPLRRPFYVETAQGRMRALGTRFSVRRDDEAAQTTLAVYEGAVEVRAFGGASAVVEAGRQARFSADAVSATEPADPAREAWTRGMLIARDLPLADMVAELRRHYRGHLGVSPDVAGLRVFGSYPAGDPEQALAMLESVLPIRVSRPLPWWISIEPGTPSARR